MADGLVSDMRRYRYVGPESVRAKALMEPAGTPIHTRADLAHWLADHADEREGELLIATFVIKEDGILNLASRRSEHVACAAGASVLAAGEIAFTLAGSLEIASVSNLSTGYCPEPESWPAVASALKLAGITAPDGYTDAFIFRRCTACGERNLVKDEAFSCAICNGDLPSTWNFDTP